MQSVIERRIQDWFKRNSQSNPAAAAELRELRHQLREEQARIRVLRKAFDAWKEAHASGHLSERSEDDTGLEGVNVVAHRRADLLELS